MSRQVQTIANARRGTLVKVQGFKTKIHQYPDVKEFIDKQLDKGVTEPKIYHDAVNKFGKEKVASIPGIKNYKLKYWQQERMVMPTLKFNHDLMKYDAYKQLVELAQEHWTRYEVFKERELTMKIPNAVIQRELIAYKDVLTKIIDIEIRIGYRQGSLNPTINVDNSKTTNVSINMQENIDDAIADVDKLIELQQRLSTYRTRGTTEPGGEPIEAQVVDDRINGDVQRADTGVPEQLAS